jgi:aspartyl-tRNA(Asn)/glutamyl-tRNA(Gln) amidotransferase subunit A
VGSRPDAGRVQRGQRGGRGLGPGPLSVGTDGGGSIRIPASFCGIVGLKPTQGRIPVYPPSTFGTLSHVGPMARTVADAALLLDVLSAPDFRDPLALDQQAPAAAEATARRVSGLRVAYSPALGYDALVLAACAAIEAVLPWRDRWPGRQPG